MDVPRWAAAGSEASLRTIAVSNDSSGSSSRRIPPLAGALTMVRSRPMSRSVPSEKSVSSCSDGFLRQLRYPAMRWGRPVLSTSSSRLSKPGTADTRAVVMRLNQAFLVRDGVAFMSAIIELPNSRAPRSAPGRPCLMTRGTRWK